MRDPDWSRLETAVGPQLKDGSKVAVLGGGPAGSFFSYYLLDMARRAGLELEVDVYESRDFFKAAPQGCNMCGGIISESLVQNLATEGVILPPTVVQRGIDSYMLHTDVGDVRIATPLDEMRIGAVYRGSGPRDIKEHKWESFDGHLERLAQKKGARVIRERVVEASRHQGWPEIRTRDGEPRRYDLLAVAAGVNAGSLKLFEGLGLEYEPPETTKTFIREYFLGEERIGQVLGSAMHVFLLNIPRLEFAAIIPKGDYVSLCLLGDDIDDALLQSFLSAPEVKRCMPEDWNAEARSCWCAPRINIQGAPQPYADRIVFVGDCAVTRLYKDGIGAAYRAAKAAARTAVFEGISAQSFKEHYWPLCRKIARDNAVGKVTFGVTRIIQKLPFARRAVVRMTAAEQARAGRSRRMSSVLWDLFTGSASYTEVFLRTLHPVFLVRLLGNLFLSILRPRAGGGNHGKWRAGQALP
ncbi:MAG: NAD(P)/FAD-dependent oxidoreductase [Planctomycetota bacterium]|jgi:flavin-dependent dehydrogenase